MKKILVVEDDFYLRRNLKEILQKEDFEVLTAASVGEASGYIHGNHEIDLYLLDIWLPDGDGFEICREIRKKSNCPILFLSVCEDEESVVQGLNMGADDYIIKPYRTKELLSRIHANLRKREMQDAGNCLKSGDLLLDKKQGCITKQGERIRLTPVEFSLLLKLMENSERIVKREQLLACFRKDGIDVVEDNTLSVTLSRLRSKIGSEYIETIRGFGYRFVGKVQKEIYESL